METKGDVRPLAHKADRKSSSDGHRHGNDDERIRYAIANKHLIKFLLYDLWRIAEPHDYGIRGGSPQLLVYQVGGESRSGRLPAWRWVVLGHASKFEVLDDTFPGSRNAEVNHHIPWQKVFARVG
jgi:hypothetical protein